MSLKQNQNTLEVKIDVWKRDTEVEDFKKELSEVENEIKKTKDSLQQIEDKRYSRKAKNAMLDQLGAYIEEINKKANRNLKLTRNQGLILENYLFSGILTDLQYYIIDEPYGHHVPAYLHYTYSNENSIEIQDLSDFLKEEIQTLNQIQNPDYIKLINFYENFRTRILTRFVE